MDYWSKVTNTFKDVENVLGYEIINEPWGGDIYADPDLILPGVADRKKFGTVL